MYVFVYYDSGFWDFHGDFDLGSVSRSIEIGSLRSEVDQVKMALNSKNVNKWGGPDAIVP